ncbi:MAG: ATP-binding cassette domain-containing protein [Clostridiales bacterium]|nr:ATP-binding cassette domain-containing protein [Clostridiales bacterium]
MIEFKSVSHYYGETPALNDVSFTVPDGSITGLVGPNGAGKTTAMKILMGIIRPCKGSAAIDGKPFRDTFLPMSKVGALITPEWIPRDRTAMNVLCGLALTHGIPRQRCRDLLGLVGLGDVANRQVRTFSLGMRQRLGIATALLGEPTHLVLDEPVNGLDPEGVVWVRQFLKDYVNEGRSVLLSSHLMSELQNTADRVVILSEGRVVADDAMNSLLASASDESVYVEADDIERLIKLLGLEGYAALPRERGAVVSGVTARQISAVALRGGVLLDRLEPRQDTLEDVFFGLTGEDGRDARAVV